MIPVKPSNSKGSLASDPVVVWLVIGLGIGIGLGLIFDSLLVAAAAGALAGTAIGFYLKAPKDRSPTSHR